MMSDEDFAHIKEYPRYKELILIQSESLLTYDEQEELIRISTIILYDLMKNNKAINDVLCRLRWSQCKQSE